MACKNKLQWIWSNTNGAGGFEGFLGSIMPLDWLKIGLNSVEKLCYCLWEYHWKANSEIQSCP